MCVLGLGYNSIASAQSDYPANADRIRDEQESVVKDWIRAGQKKIESFKSPLIDAKEVAKKLPSECVAHLKKEKEELAKSGFSKEVWMHHVFECEKCCALLLVDMMYMHVQRVVQQPHLMVLFDFDQYEIKELFKKKLNELVVKNFRKDRDKILLIGRASRIGDRAYNVVLSGKRAGAVKDYLMEEFGVDDAKVRFLYFGYDPPQLTLEYAQAYGVTEAELAYIDSLLSFKNTSDHKINQSVVVVFYGDQERKEEG
jgi:outer membrane protein OmpA-like peptidoglycan-associated protein